MIYKYIMLIVLNSMDMILTEYIIKSGIGYEYNPIMDYLISNYGFFVTSSVKTGVIVISGYLLYLKTANLKMIYTVLGYIVLVSYFSIVTYSSYMIFSN